ncbi:hypothetical protein B0H19DRAFT_1226004, partial [Mycena capillaripes]
MPKFREPLTLSSHIAALVDELCIVLVGSKTPFGYDSDGDYLSERHVPWIMTDKTLSLVLPLLDLKRISLVENSPYDWDSEGKFSMSWMNLESQLKTVLANIFSSPRL